MTRTVVAACPDWFAAWFTLAEQSQGAIVHLDRFSISSIQFADSAG